MVQNIRQVFVTPTQYTVFSPLLVFDITCFLAIMLPRGHFDPQIIGMLLFVGNGADWPGPSNESLGL